MPHDFMTDINMIEKRIEARKAHMSVLKRCMFELKGVPQFESFIERLREFISSLRNICSELQASVRAILRTSVSCASLTLQQMDREIPRAISDNRNPEKLRAVSAVYEEEVTRRRKAGSDSSGRELVGDIAKFKARSIHLVKKREALVEERRRSGLRSEGFLLDGQFLQKSDFLIKSEKKLTKFGLGEDADLGLLLAVDTKRGKACFVVRALLKA